MRSVVKGPAPLDEHHVTVVFAQYQDAIPYLKERLGRYCSYCERTIPANLAVEHKLPKEHHPHLKLEWDNLLLSCVNCNSSKGQTNPQDASMFWPDEHDTFDLISYAPNGAVRPRQGLDPATEARVHYTLFLLGLSRLPAELSSADHRFFDRLEVWRRASQSLEDLAGRDIPELRRAIIETAKASGGYSIWQHVFAADAAMREALRTTFVGTRDFTV